MADKPKLTRAERKQIEAVIRKYRGDGKPHTAQDTIPYQIMYPDGICYRKAIQTCAALMEQLSQRLSKEDYALVEELRAQNAIAQCEESESHFKYGFSAGLIVQQEAHEQLQNKK